MNRAFPERNELRSSGFHVRFNGHWYESAHVFTDGYPTGISLGLSSADTGEKFRVPASEVEAMERVTVRVKYRGRWFGLGSFWSTPSGPDWRDPAKGGIGGSTRSRVDWMRETCGPSGCAIGPHALKARRFGVYLGEQHGAIESAAARRGTRRFSGRGPVG